MPCSRCGRIGHNIRTCSRLHARDDPRSRMIRIPRMIRIQNDIDEQVIKNQDMMVIVH